MSRKPPPDKHPLIELKYLPHRLGEAIDRRGLQQKELAGMAKVSQSSVSRILAGEVYSVTVDTMIRLADALEVPRSWLVFGEGESPFRTLRSVK